MKNYLLWWIVALFAFVPMIANADPSWWWAWHPVTQSNWLVNTCTEGNYSSFSCDYTWSPEVLRLGYEYKFRDRFWAWSTDRWLRKFCSYIHENGDYNKASNPSFDWTQEIRDSQWLVAKWTDMLVISANGMYQIKQVPSKRSSDNVMVKYVIEYENETKNNGNRYQHTECFPYEISWCGDGVVDTDWYKKDPSDPAEECDPEASEWKNRSDWKTCSNTCKIVEPAAPVCSSTYNGKTQYTSSSDQWLKSTDDLCDEWEVVDFVYSGTPRIYTWNCKNWSKKTNPSCSAKQQRCWDWEKNWSEDCDDWANNGTAGSSCSSTCTTVWSASCWPNDGWTTYFSSKQTIPWLTKTSAWMCPAGLVVGTPTIKWDDNHLEWTCSNSNGGERTCKAYQEYCWDWVKNWEEECDWTDGCDSQCKKIKPAEWCEQTFRWTIRYLDEVQFSDTFNAWWHDRYLYYWPDDVIFKENHGDYNNGSNPTFQWTSQLTNNWMKVAANTSMTVIESKLPKYKVVKYPSQRAWDNIYIEYTTWYENEYKSPAPSKSNLYSHKECAYYEITRCGDGILDADYWEECDPWSEWTSVLPDGRICNSDCKIWDAPTKWKAKIEKTLKDKVPVEKVWQTLKWTVNVTAIWWDVTDFEVRDLLPEALDYVDYKVVSNPDNLQLTWPTWPVKSWSNNVYTWDVKWTLKSWDGHVLTLEIETKVNKMPKADDDYRNIACVVDDGDKDCDEDKPDPTWKVKIEKTLKDKKKVEKTGEILTWDIKVWAEWWDVTDFQIEDIVPVALKYKGYTVKSNPDNLTVNNPTWPVMSWEDSVYTWDVKWTLKSWDGHELLIEVTTEVVKMPKSDDDYRNVACVIKDNKKDCDDDKPDPSNGHLEPLKTLIGSKEIRSTWDVVKWSLKVTAKWWDIENPIITDKLPPVLGYSGFEVNHSGWLDIPKYPTSSTFQSWGETWTEIVWNTKWTLKEDDYIEIILTTYAKFMPDKDYDNVLCTRPEWTDPEDDDCDDAPVPSPKLWIKKSFTDGTKTKAVKIWDKIGYKITFGNKWTASATITSVKDFLPKNVKYITGSIVINWKSVHTNQEAWSEVINTSKKVDWVYVDIYGWITLNPWDSWYIILTWEVLWEYLDTTKQNWACIYLNDKKPDDDLIDGDWCDYAEHTLDNVSCKPTLSPSSFAEVCPSDTTTFTTNVTCSSTWWKADIEIICEGKTIKTWHVEQLTWTCSSNVNDSDHKVQCKINGKTTWANWEACEANFRRNTKSCGWGSSCFVAWTKVLMADGTEKNIEDVRKWEFVMWESWPNEVKWYDRPKLWDRNLWSINGWDYFVSDEHPFMTTDWWKSFNPEMSRLEIKAAVEQGLLSEELLIFGELKEWDELYTKNGSRIINSLSSQKKDPNTQLYNFMLDWDNTYYANGYLVHNKWWWGGWTTKHPACSKIEIESDGTVTCHATEKTAYFKLVCDGKTYYSFDYKNWGKKLRDYTFNVKCKDATVQCYVNEDETTWTSWWKSSSDCKKTVKKSWSQECFNLNAWNFSIEEWEILPFYWNLFNMEEWVKDNEDSYMEIDWNYAKAIDLYNNPPKSCEEDEEWQIATDSMVCTFKIYDGGSYNTTPLYTIQWPCLSAENVHPLSTPLLSAWYEEMKRTYCGNPSKPCYFSYNEGRSTESALLNSAVYYIQGFWTNAGVYMNGEKWDKAHWDFAWKDESKKSYGEYRIVLEEIKYLQCESEVWEKKVNPQEFDPCQSNFTLTNSYTVQKTPSGNLTASSDELSKYRYLDKAQVFYDLIKTSISTSTYSKNEKVKDAMKNFIGKYEKLAVKVDTNKFWNGDITVKKVPWKDIYFIDGNATFKQSSNTINKPFTIVQTRWNTTINGNLQHNMMLLTEWNIIFNGNCTSQQKVKWIFYAGGNLIRSGIEKNTKTDKGVWCTKGWLYVQWVLIWDNFDNLMKASRSNLNDWFNDKSAKTVMNWASVLIEYSPSIFTKSTMPPGAEDFTTALSIYKK